ncbi:glomulin [Episyrphus balteatus]|uniref:glomulin n=1 Tax=Episyrphus balteatus TaxID=286459 RepID=UPI0024868E0A|nr:glomulin [Episyrphus balteatus]
MAAKGVKLLETIKKCLQNKEYDQVLGLFNTEQIDNIDLLKLITADLLEILLVHLNDDNYKNNLDLYTCCEEIMKLAATHSQAEEILFELLQIVEESPSENVFTTALKCLQICLLRLKSDKSRALEWTLNSIVNRITELKLPSYVVSGCSPRQEKLLEQDDDVLKVLANYITLALFYEPLLEDVLKDSDDDSKKTNRRNVLCCFFLQLLGKPLCYLDLTKNEKLTNTYTMQCAASLVKAATKILDDPFYLLSLVEEKAKNKSHPSEDVDESVDLSSPENIFKMEEKLPIESMGIFYYLLIVEEIGFESAPKIYCPVYIFESCLYLVTDFLSRKAPTLQKRGLLLCHKIIDNMGDLQIPDKSLFEPIHQNFTKVLAQIIGFSAMKSFRQSAVQLLKKYILRFGDESKCVTIKSLILSVKHAGLQGYLGTIYKDLVAEKLATIKDDSDTKLPGCYSGEEFSDFLLKHICVLQKGVETDLIENSDRIIPALNSIRFFAITDDKNLTGFWDLSKKIEKDFLDPLRMAINMSVAHYELEKNSVKTNKGGRNEDYEKMAEMFSISALNGSDASLAIEPGKQMEILDQGLTSLDLLKCLLARATECIEKRHKKK